MYDGVYMLHPRVHHWLDLTSSPPVNPSQPLRTRWRMKYNTFAMSRTRVAVAVERQERYSSATTTSLEQTEESEIFHPYTQESEARNNGSAHPDDDPFRLFESNSSLPGRHFSNRVDHIYYISQRIYYTYHDLRKVYIKVSLERD